MVNLCFFVCPGIEKRGKIFFFQCEKNKFKFLLFFGKVSYKTNLKKVCHPLRSHIAHRKFSYVSSLIFIIYMTLMRKNNRMK
jgi:hypothetical protein